MPERHKLSTTISPSSYAYLEHMVESGAARSLAEAVDLAVETRRQVENRRHLERDTAAYFANLSPEGAREEISLADALSGAAGQVDFDE
jgi:hypothetical protein